MWRGLTFFVPALFLLLGSLHDRLLLRLYSVHPHFGAELAWRDLVRPHALLGRTARALRLL